MTTEAKSWHSLQEMLGSNYKQGKKCLYKELNSGLRIEVTGTMSDEFPRHFNVYLIDGDNEIGQSAGVPQEKLLQEIDLMCYLAGAI